MNNTILKIRLIPRASKNEVVGFSQEILRVRVSAPPIEGRANRDLAKLLSRALGVSTRDIQIVKGQRSRNKLVRVQGLTREGALHRLRARG
ncbi:MAG: DUF167 domain-containing protein [Dehalococcoidia bacterium]